MREAGNAACPASEALRPENYLARCRLGGVAGVARRGRPQGCGSFLFSSYLIPAADKSRPGDEGAKQCSMACLGGIRA